MLLHIECFVAPNTSDIMTLLNTLLNQILYMKSQVMYHYSWIHNLQNFHNRWDQLLQGPAMKISLKQGHSIGTPLNLGLLWRMDRSNHLVLVLQVVRLNVLTSSPLMSLSRNQTLLVQTSLLSILFRMSRVIICILIVFNIVLIFSLGLITVLLHL